MKAVKKLNKSAAVCDSYIPDDDTDLIVNTLQAVIFTMRGLSGFDNCSNGEDPFVKDSASTKRKYKSLESEKKYSEQQSTGKTMSPAYKKMLDAGSKNCVFSINGHYKILKAPVPLLAVLRTSADRSEKVLCLLNISGRILKLFVYWDELSCFNNGRLYDIINMKESGALVILADEEKKQGRNDSEKFDTECSAMINLYPWEVVWLK